MKDLSEQTYYEVLELDPGCAADALLKAYALAKERYGPGSLATYALAEPGEAEALLRRIEEAFAVLSDPGRRLAYDAASGRASNGWEPEPAQIESRPLDPTEPAQVAAEPGQAAAAPPSIEPAPESLAAAPAPPEPLIAAPAPSPVPPEDQKTGLKEEPLAVAAERVEALGQEAAPEAIPDLKTETKVETKAEPEPKPVRKTESELPADSAVTGEALRRVREARGLTLKDVENRTKIGHWHLENIERERYDDLPAQVYLRGFLMSLARELKLDPVRVARSYLEQMKAKPQAKTE